MNAPRNIAMFASLWFLLGIAARAQPAVGVVLEFDKGHHRVLDVDANTQIKWVRAKTYDAVAVSLSPSSPCSGAGEPGNGVCTLSNATPAQYTFRYCTSFTGDPAQCNDGVTGDFQIRVRSSTETRIPSVPVVFLELLPKANQRGLGEVRNYLTVGEVMVWLKKNGDLQDIAFKTDNSQALADPCSAVQTGLCNTTGMAPGPYRYQCARVDCDDPVIHVENQSPQVVKKPVVVKVLVISISGLLALILASAILFFGWRPWRVTKN